MTLYPVAPNGQANTQAGVAVHGTSVLVAMPHPPTYPINTAVLSEQQHMRPHTVINMS